MTDLTYKVGKLKINASTFKCSKTDRVSHGYVVEFKGNEMYIHVSSVFTGASSHKNIAVDCGVPENDIVGGGSIYINSENYLVLDDLCEPYGTVPTETAKRLAKALLFDLNTMGFDVDVESIKANPPQYCMNKRWKLQ